MDLWTEFEGITIDSAFALNKLLQTEGRSAFFSTVNDKGEPVLIRIIECHFDEDEILARWRGVQALGHPNFLRIDRFGQFLIEADEITAVYAVFERVDANLGEVLGAGHLSAADATQIGLSLGSALEMLHAHGFVHEHVEAANIYAVGETVKLRSDCIRETPEGEAGLAARRRDVHDLAQVLRQVLLGGGHGAGAARQATLPAPFDEIVRRAMSGEWGLGEIREALTPVRPKATKAEAARGAAASPAAISVDDPKVIRVAEPVMRRKAADSATTLPLPFETAELDDATLSPRRDRVSFEPPAWTERLRHVDKRWYGAAAVVALLVLFSWMMLHKRASDAGGPASPTASSVHPRPVAATTTAAARTSSTTRAAAATAGTATRAGKQWRVVAFTYSRKDQAQKKAASLGQSRPGLAPEVFSPNGRAPWLVTIGGPLERDAAYALARKARSLGMPRDTYAQNYMVR